MRVAYVIGSLFCFAGSMGWSCDLKGNFQNIVVRELGEERARNEASFTLLVIDRQSGETICTEAVSADQNIYPASSIKTLIAFSILRKVDAGELGLDQTFEITQSNALFECRPYGCDEYGPGRRKTLRQLLNDTITVSNNIATNQLIDIATKDFCNQSADVVGAPSLRVLRKVYSYINPEPEIEERNRASSQGLAELYREIATGRLGILSQSSREFLIKALRNQEHNSMLNADFPWFVRFYHKTGNTSDSTGDGGFYYQDDERTVILVGLQNFNKFRDCESCAQRSGFTTLRKIGRKTLDLTDSIFETRSSKLGEK